MQIMEMIFKLAVVMTICVINVISISENDFPYDATSDLYGRVIHMESKLDRGRYIDYDGLKFARDLERRYMDRWYMSSHAKGYANEDKWPLCSRSAEHDIYTEPMTMFKFKQSEDTKHGVIESVDEPGDHMSFVTDYFPSSSGYPTNVPRPIFMLKRYARNDIRFYWRIKCKDSTHSDCMIINPTYNDAISFAACTLSLKDYTLKPRTCLSMANDENSRIVIKAPEPTQHYKTIKTLINDNGTPVTMELTYKTGLTTSKTVTATTKASVSIEVSAAFKAFSFKATSSLEKTWQTVDSSIFSSEETFKMTKVVAPHTRMIVQQLVGSYDQISVGTDHFKYISYPITGKREMELRGRESSERYD